MTSAHPPSDVLAHWISHPLHASLDPISHSGFSGARVWRVEHCDQSYALRRWQDGFVRERLAVIHAFQDWLARNRQPVPKLVRVRATDQTAVEYDGSLWEFSTWMPGEPSYRTNPSKDKLVAALQALALLHQAASQAPGNRIGRPSEAGVSSALVSRRDQLSELIRLRIGELGDAWNPRLPASESLLIREALELVGRTAEVEWQKSNCWHSRPLPLQFCLRDVTHEHVLFTDSRVTGIVDFGAVAFDSAAGDVARLLGSMAGDDRVQWRIGLQAYETVRMLSDGERDAIVYFDSSGTVLSTYNWVKWLLEPSAGETLTWRREAAFKRLRELVGRMQVLANRGAVG